MAESVTPNGTQAHAGYRSEIDGLRAIAVLAVVAYHAGLPGAGFVGVDIFFVISGYLITGLLLREERIDLWAFYARRARRIVPALAVVVASTFALGAVLLPARSVLQLGDSAVAGLLMGANIYFPMVSGGYFDGSTIYMPLLHLWSLGVEEQFYLAWPLVLAFTPRRWLGVVLAGLCVASLAASELVGQEMAFYGAPFRLWELGAGGVLAWSGKRGGAFHTAAGLALLAVAIAIPSPRFPGVGALPAVLGSLLVIYGGNAGPGGRLLSSRPMVLVGLISYSLYLWHWPLLAIDRALRVLESPLGVRVALCGAAVVLAGLTYLLVERPFRRMRSTATARHVVATAATGVAVLLIGIWVAMAPARGVHAIDSAVDSVVDAIDKDVPPLFRPCIRKWNPADPMPKPECRTGSGPITVVWGDSHALFWDPAIEREGVTIERYAIGGCPPIVGFNIALDGVDANCKKFVWRVLARIRRGDVDRVILAARWSALVEVHGLPDGFKNTFKLATPTQQAARHAAAWPAFQATLRMIAPHVREVVVMGPLPQLRADIKRCVRMDVDCSVPRAVIDALNGDALARIQQAAAQFENVRAVDPMPFFCSRDWCPMARNGAYLFWDEDHISASAAHAYGVAHPL